MRRVLRALPVLGVAVVLGFTVLGCGASDTASGGKISADKMTGKMSGDKMSDKMSDSKMDAMGGDKMGDKMTDKMATEKK